MHLFRLFALLSCAALFSPSMHAGVDYSGQDRTGADLAGQNLTAATLTGTNLTSANLTNANLTDARLENATLTGATLTGATLTRARFNAATVWPAGFNPLNKGMFGPGVDLAGVVLPVAGYRPNLALQGANLAGATLAENDLTGSNLTGANLTGANLRYVDATSTNLTNANLTNANLTDIRLEGATLAGATLAGATLTRARFNAATVWPAGFNPLDKAMLGPGVDLTGTVFSAGSYRPNLALQGANLTGVNLERNNVPGSNLSGANLTGANLRFIDATDTNLTNANLTNADLTDAQLERATLTGAILTGATLTRARFNAATVWPAGFNPLNKGMFGPGVDLAGVVLPVAGYRPNLALQGANLAGATLAENDLTGSNLTGSNLTGAILRNCNLTGVDFRRALLGAASLIGTNVTGANFTGALYDGRTIWPSGFDPVAAGAVNVSTALADGLVARYGFNGSGAEASDSTLNLTGSGTFGYVPDRHGRAGRAVQLTSPPSTSAYFFNGTGPALANSSSSVAFWVRKEFAAGGDWVFGLGEGGGNGLAMSVALDYNSGIRYSFWNNDFDLTNSLSSSAWQQVVATYDRTTRERKVYLNGVLLGTNAALYGFTGNTALKIGFTGITLDDLRFYNRVLSASEVTALQGLTEELQVPQTITFVALPDVNAGSGPITLAATASSGLAVTFSVLSGPATVTGTTLTLTGSGPVVVRAAQAGDATYAPAAPLDRSFNVNAPPAITVQPVAQTIAAGSAATLSVTATGAAPLSYQWRRGGTGLTGATNATLTLPAVAAADAGTYDVVVTNSVSAARSAGALLTVTGATSGDFAYSTNGTAATLSGYTGTGGAVSIPAAIGGFPLTAIGQNAFLGKTTLTSVTLPGTITTIGAQAFGSCTGLTSVSIPQGVTSIGQGGFDSCSALLTLHLPASVTSIGSNAFRGNLGMTTITVDAANPAYSSDGKVLFNKARTTLIKAAIAGISGTYVVPSTVTSIGQHAFRGCTGLTRIILPAGLTSIASNAFHTCTALGEVVFPASLTSIGSLAFDGCPLITRAIFLGGAPTFDAAFPPFRANMLPVVYYLPSATDWGAVYAGATTTVMATPAITNQPQSQSVFTGSTVTFTVTGTGTPAPVYQWRKGAADLPGATNAAYTISAAALSDAGAYDVRISNAAGTATSVAAALTAHPALRVPSQYATIQAAIDAATTGDTIILARGVYAEAITMRKGVTLRSDYTGAQPSAEDVAQTVLESLNNGKPILGLGSHGTVPAVLDGVTVRGLASGVEARIYCEALSIVRNCVFTARIQGGDIRSDGTSAARLIENCDFLGGTVGVGSAGGGSGLEIRGCRFQNYTRSAVFTSEGTLITDSVFKDSAIGIEHWVGTGAPISVINCTLNRNGVAFTGGNLNLVNTIIWGNTEVWSGSKGYVQQGPGSIISIRDSLVQGGAATWADLYPGNLTYGPNNLTTDPKFVSAASGDYRLADDSPALGAGGPLPLGVTGVRAAVPVGSALDLGALENARAFPATTGFAVFGVIAHNGCAGAANGTIQLFVNNGPEPLSYAWTGPSGFTSNAKDLAGLRSGTYAVTVTGGGQTATNSFTVREPPPLTLAATICGQFPQVTLGLSAGGGTPPYSVAWEGGGNAWQRIVTAAGTYAVTLTDAAGCSLRKEIVVPSLLAPRTFHVATTGSDGGLGTPTQPFRTIQFAVDNACEGDTIILARGVYAEAITMRKGVTLRSDYSGARPSAEDVAQTVLESLNNGRPILGLGSHGTVPAVLDGVTVRGLASGVEARIYCEALSIVRNCVFTARIQGGDIRSDGTSAARLIENCDFLGGTVGVGSAGGGSGLEIRGCRFQNYTRSAVFTSEGTLITDSVFKDSAIGIEHWVGTGAPIRVINCTLNRNGVAFTGGNLNLVNTIIWGNTEVWSGSKGYVQQGPGSIISIRDSLVQGGAATWADLYPGNLTYGPNNLTTDPKFISAASGDYRLADDSPALGAGGPLPVGVTGIRAAVPVGSALDLGALENARAFPVGGGPRAQTIDFPALPNRTFGDPAFTVSATASSGFPVTLTVISGPALVSGNSVTLSGAGSVTLAATQSGTAGFLPAAEVRRTFEVAPAMPLITWNPPPSLPLGTVLGAAHFNAIATPTGGTFAYSPPIGTALHASGVQELSVTYTPAAGDAANFTAAVATRSVNVTAAAVPEASLQLVGPAYYLPAGGSLNLQAGIAYAGLSPSALGFTLQLPAGWTLASVGGPQAPNVSPAAGAAGTLEFAYANLPANAAFFSVVLNYPAGLSGIQSLAGSATYRSPLQGLSFSPVLLPRLDPPAITTAPAGGVFRTGARLTLSVVASSPAPMTYQWSKDDVPVAGATGASLTLPALSLAQAGTYTVTVRNAAGETTSAAARVSVLELQATHAPGATGYTAGGTITVTNTLTFTPGLSSLSWEVLPPAGWTYAGGAGTEGSTRPAVGSGELLTWSWSAVPASPLVFSYTLNVPAGTSGEKNLSALVRPAVATGGVQILAQPEPLRLPSADLHSADTNRDQQIDLLELTRVIELYNTRKGLNRTGAYRVQEGSEDGYASEPARAPGANVSLARHHSADTDRNGRLVILELTRVIELYNHREAGLRTGRYRIATGSEDGFAPGS